MSRDERELEALSAAWTASGPEAPEELVRYVARAGRWQRWKLAGGSVAAVVFLCVAFRAAVLSGSVEFVVLAVGVWMFTLSAAIFQWQNQQGTGVPESQTTAEYLAVSVRRCRSAVRATEFGMWMLAAQVAMLGCWHGWYWWSRPARPSVGLWLVAAVFVLGCLTGLVVVRGRRLGEMGRLERLQREQMD